MSKEEVVQFRKKFRQEIIPNRYSGILHVSFNGLTMLAICIYLLSKLKDVTSTEVIVIPIAILICNLGVYIIHKFLLHRIQPLIHPFTFRVHNEWHHHFYTDELIIYEQQKDFHILFFPPAVVLGFILIYIPAVYYLLELFFSLNIVYLYLIVFTVYFILYEVFHFISHLRHDHPLLRFPWFRLMWKHHGTHHNLELMYQYNFNIVFPLFDYIFGTVYKENCSDEK